ncbi:MAG TPA: ABC transporter permease [Candidatus Wolfebacteria bacterium]|nr:ABC transporter permease [Candidatus Wolfebacteria bacterium]
MFTALSRIIKYGIQGFWRNGWLSTTTILIMVLALIVFEGLIIFNVLTKTALQTVQDKIDISVYFKIETPEDDILKTKKSLESLTEVKEVEYISRDKALTIFQERHQEDKLISQALEELEGNPLEASLNIKAYDPKEYESIAGYLDNESLKSLISKVTYAQNAVVINRLAKIIDTSEKGGLILTFLLAFIAIVVSFNTIRLAIYSNREEIGIMRLVGASNSFVRGPYVVEGIIYGLIAGCLSILIIAPAIYFIASHIEVFVSEINLWNYFTSNFVVFLGYQILFGISLGIISSTIAIRRYLRI